MHPVRKQRLQVVIFIVLVSSLAVGFLLFALRDNINLFYPPSDFAAGNVPINKAVRAGGMVREGSVIREADTLRVAFMVTDYEADLKVTYEGILPDLFSEGQGVVVAGKLQEDGRFEASEVLAKHDENYMPPEVADSLKTGANAGEGTAGDDS
ncbi:MAG: cytochrome c maturation protein CcmE [Pseudomonadales bacterium]